MVTYSGCSGRQFARRGTVGVTPEFYSGKRFDVGAGFVASVSAQRLAAL